MLHEKILPITEASLYSGIHSKLTVYRLSNMSDEPMRKKHMNDLSKRSHERNTVMNSSWQIVASSGKARFQTQHKKLAKPKRAEIHCSNKAQDTFKVPTVEMRKALLGQGLLAHIEKTEKEDQALLNDLIAACKQAPSTSHPA
jgi:hypothetical protein